jgi:uncharacterized membrane protein
VPVLPILLLAVGLPIFAVGLLGLRERLPRNRFLGVRTPASLRDDETFRVANKVAGLPTIVAGLVAVVAATAAFLVPGTGALIVCVVLGLVGMFAITIGAGVLGNRAALAVPEPLASDRPVPAGCGGCQCGSCPVKPIKTAST